ncbi:MAG: AgmX/PglI C-terminal domain-containing protein [Myxococcales bacterium]|nr:AgmX/PglI C-terminal domain-containing protein [Myxococcales bacterium]
MQVVLDDSSNPYQTPSRRKSRTIKIGLGIVIGVVVGNAVGYGAHRLILMQEAAEFTVNDEQREQVHRRSALHAMEIGDYELAISELSAALRTASPASDLSRLLALAQNLRSRKKDLSVVDADEVVGQQEQDLVETRDPAEKSEPIPGLLLVTTTPSHMTIYIDGDARDMSPARLELKPGVYQVVLKYGAKELFRRKLRIREGTVLPINPDFTKQVAALSSSKRPGFRSKPDVKPRVKLPPPRILSLDSASGSVRPNSSGTTSKGELSTSTSTVLLASPDDAGWGRADLQAKLSTTSANVASKAATTPPKAVPPQDKASPEQALVERTKAVKRDKSKRPKVKPLSKTLVHQVVGEAAGKLRRCYRLGLQADPDLAGHLDVQLKVKPNGKVLEGRVIESTLDGPRVRLCIEHELKRLLFPFRPNGKLEVVTTRINFRP